MQSILFSFKIDSVKFQDVNSTFNISKPFIRDEIIIDCQKQLNKVGYTISGYENFNFIEKNNVLYVEGMAHEIQEAPFMGTYIV